VLEIEASLANDHKPSINDAFGGTAVFKPIVWVGIGLATFQQLVGINIIFYYGAVLWQAVGFSESDALLTNVISGAVSILAVLVALALIDKVGRKPLLWVGSIGMTVTLAIVALCFSQAVMVDGRVGLPGSYGIIALLAANGYVVFFNASWGPVMWVALGEMFPNQVRGAGLAVSGFFQWIANFGITMTFPIMLSVAWIGLTGAYLFYAVCALISVFFVMKYVRETKGLELEDMTE
jgi:SP family sugar:H+ symporter-like MFS transporter